ncbi:radical SAM protein [Burkholderia cepacia]|uniref:radical SAM protein n=1 Tax=Burkholderia cepacia TaxID=292 RepID=UPI002FE38527
MIGIRQLTVLTTNQCTASCGHCLVSSSPQRRGRLSLGTICETIDEIIGRGNPLSLVIFAGGEPTLLKTDLLDAIAFCAEKGLGTRMVTNASWAISETVAERMVESFREAGLAEINYSVDDHHEPDIEFGRVVNAWRASKNKGFDSVVLANCYGTSSRITAEFIREQLSEDLPVYWEADGTPTTRDVPPSEDGTRYLLSNARLQRLGRGANLPDEAIEIPEQARLNSPCPWAIESAALSPGSHLVACCGTEAHGNEFLDFGDVRKHSIDELLKVANQSLVVNAIRKFGPYFLMNFVKTFSQEELFKKKYGSVCEICEDVVKNPKSREIINAHLSELSPFLE